MSSGLIDWNLLAEIVAVPAMSQPAMWDAFARKYNGYARLEEDYTRLQIEAMRLESQDTLLDIGCGPGRIAVPAAPRVKAVTALDTSRLMLDELERNVREAGAANVHALHLPWDEVVPGENVDIHDVVVASRSPAMKDLAKIDAMARKFVYVMTFAGPSLKSFHDTLVSGTELAPPPSNPIRSPFKGNTLLYNRIADMGVEVNVFHVPDGFTKRYPSRDAANADFDWLGLPAASLARFRENLSPFLSPEGDGIRLRWETRTAVFWWDKTRHCADPNVAKLA